MKLYDYYRVMQGTGFVALPTEQARYGRLPGENIIKRRRKKTPMMMMESLRKKMKKKMNERLRKKSAFRN